MAPNILLVVLDSVRARNTSLHGHFNDTTPFLCDFADSTTVYTNARAPSIGSRPSHASLFTGHHAVETGISSDTKLKTGTTVWERLQADGYDTAVFSDNPFLRSNRWGYTHGFETIRTKPADYVDPPFSGGIEPRASSDVNDARSGIKAAFNSDAPVRSLLNGVSIMLGKKSPRLQRWFGLHHDTTAETYLDSFEAWRDNRSGPWAACINLMDAHYPYEPAAEFDRWGSTVLRRLQDEWSDSNYDPTEFHDGRRPWWQLEAFESLYDGSILHLDSAVERLVTHLESVGCLDETLLVVTSDHGERFGERSYFDPSYRLVAHGADGGIHDDNVHVPLVVKFPEQQTGHRVHRPASLTEFPGVVESVRNDDADHDAFVPDGPVLVTLDPGYESSACAVYDTDGGDVRMQTKYRGDGVTVAIRDAQTKCVVADSAPAVRDRTWTERNLSVPQETTDIDQSTRSHLADLGYVN